MLIKKLTNQLTVILPSVFVVTATFSGITFSAEPTLKLIPILTLEIAQKIAHACETRQVKNNKPPVNIAIFDQGANLILFHRMTDATLGTAAVAMEKGKSTANFPVSTRQWGAATYGEKGSPGIAFIPNISTVTGGIPIVTSDGAHLGGIGVSGSSGDDDEACALAGLEVVKTYLSTTP